jgi:hypothetical protein
MWSDVAARYARDGWVNAGPILDEGEIAALREGVDQVIDDCVRRARYPSREACLRIVQLWHDPWRVAPAYAALRRHPVLADLGRTVLDAPSVRVATQRLILKPPRGCSPLPWHQDQAGWPIATPRGVAIWLALDDVDGESGGLRYRTGSHRSGTAGDPVDGVVRAGEALLHHAQTWHASTSNRSDRWRRACILLLVDARVPPREGAWDAVAHPVVDVPRCRA